MDEIREKILPLLLVALILGLVNSFVRPILTILSIPFIILTLGLFLLVINAAMLLLTDWLADLLDIGFQVDGFWPAVGGAIIITLVTWSSTARPAPGTSGDGPAARRAQAGPLPDRRGLPRQHLPLADGRGGARADGSPRPGSTTGSRWPAAAPATGTSATRWTSGPPPP